MPKLPKKQSDFVSYLVKQGSHIPTDTLRNLHGYLEGELRVRWYIGLDSFLTLISQKFVTAAKVQRVEPFQLWVRVEDVKYSFFKKVIVPNLIHLSEDYPLNVKVYFVNVDAGLLIPFAALKEEEEATTKKFDALFLVDIPQEDFKFIHTSLKTAGPATEISRFLECCVGARQVTNWPPKTIEELPASMRWPQFISFDPGRQKIEADIDVSTELNEESLPQYINTLWEKYGEIQ
jgi:hypothetical protein